MFWSTLNCLFWQQNCVNVSSADSFWHFCAVLLAWFVFRCLRHSFPLQDVAALEKAEEIYIKKHTRKPLFRQNTVKPHYGLEKQQKHAFRLLWHSWLSSESESSYKYVVLFWGAALFCTNHQKMQVWHLLGKTLFFVKEQIELFLSIFCLLVLISGKIGCFYIEDNVKKKTWEKDHSDN